MMNRVAPTRERHGYCLFARLAPALRASRAMREQLHITHDPRRLQILQPVQLALEIALHQADDRLTH